MEFLEESHIQEALRRLSEQVSTKISHKIVTWTIENFLDFSYPNINYGTASCTIDDFGQFHLQMSPKFAQDLINLQFAMKLNAVKGNICIRFGYKMANGIVWLNEKSVPFYQILTIHYVCPNISNYFNSSTKTCVIKCEFLLTIHVPKHMAFTASDSLEYGFPLDFFHLYSTGYLSDLRLRIGEPNFEFRAHRAILYSKSGVFRKMLSEMPSNKDTLELLELNPKTMLSLLLYIYTGNFKLWLKFCYPTTDLYDYADKFEIDGLKQCLQPTEINISQTTLAIFIDINFEIVNFKNLEKSYFFPRASPLYILPSGIFFLFLSFDSSGDKYNIHLQLVQVWYYFSLHLNISVSHSEIKESKCYQLKKIFEPTQSNIFEIGSFSKDLFNHSSSEDVLSISGECLFTSHICNDEFHFRVMNKPIQGQLETFGSLLENNPHADLEFIVKDKECLAHKFILGTRLKFFRDLFDSKEKTKKISIDDMSATTLESFLGYVYTGDIETGLDIDNLLNLIPVWKRFGNDVFGVILFRSLSIKMDVSNVCKILWKLYSLRNIDFFDDLKHAAMTYLCRSFTEIESSEFWNKAVSEDEEIAKVLLQNMSDEFKKIMHITPSLLLQDF